MVSRLALRRTWKGAVAVAVANVLVTVTAVIGYVAAYPDPADRVTLARSIGSNPGLTALFGETRSLETVAGFTEWRVVLVLALVGAVWAIFAVTRILRGEEDEGRAEVVLAGPITRPGATRASLLGIAASTGLMLLVTVVGMTLGAGGDLGTDRAVLLAVTVVSTPAVMVGVGAVTSQVADTRRRAAGMAAAVLGASYLIRVVADSSESLRWLRWATPLGWLELAHPLTEPHLLPILLALRGRPLHSGRSRGRWWGHGTRGRACWPRQVPGGPGPGSWAARWGWPSDWPRARPWPGRWALRCSGCWSGWWRGPRRRPCRTPPAGTCWDSWGSRSPARGPTSGSPSSSSPSR